MTTNTPEIVKIGKTANFEQRMRELESNGKSNFTGLKRKFAIETNGYSSKEELIHRVFARDRFTGTEFFKISDINLVIDLMKAIGRQIYPPILNDDYQDSSQYIRQDISRMETANGRKRHPTKFAMVDIPIGAKLQWKQNPAIEVEVVSVTNKVKYDSKILALTSMDRYLGEKFNGYQGGGSGYDEFLYQGETIMQRRNRLEGEFRDSIHSR